MIICGKPNFEVRSWEPSKLVISISQLFRFCIKIANLKSPISIVGNLLQLDNELRFSSRFDVNIWNLSCVWLGDLYRWMKWQILLTILNLKLMYSFRFEIFTTNKGSVTL